MSETVGSENNESVKYFLFDSFFQLSQDEDDVYICKMLNDFCKYLSFISLNHLIQELLLFSILPSALFCYQCSDDVSLRHNHSFDFIDLS
jgi:predicted component of viral defense system (DUF524 family)